MVEFIDAHRGAYGVEPICEVLPVAPSTYHEHAARRRDAERRPERAKRDESLLVEVKRVHSASRGGVYGFTAMRPNQLWVADITYVATWAGFA